LLDTERVLAEVTDELLGEIKKARQTSSSPLSLIVSITSMFRTLHLYESHFEHRFLQETRAYYHQQSHALLARESIDSYMLHCSQLLKSEQQLGSEFLALGTMTKLNHSVRDELLAVHSQAILERGFDAMMNSGNEESLRLLFQLFDGIGKLEEVRNKFKDYLRQLGSALVSNPKNDPTLIQSLLDFKARVDTVLKHAFDAHQEFQATLKDSFEFFLNIRKDRPAELIAKYFHDLLSSESRRSSADLPVMIHQVLVLFRFISSYDIFEHIFKKDLAKRLLSASASVSLEAEELLIAELRQECGSAFTTKFEGMLSDLATSKELLTPFRSAAIADGQDAALFSEVEVRVLAQSHWPPFTPLHLRPNPLIANVQERFASFYQSRFTNRLLTWQGSESYCTLRADFATGPKDLVVNFGQASILLLFATLSSRLTFQQLVVLTQPPPAPDTSNPDELARRREIDTQRLAQLRLLLSSLTTAPAAPLIRDAEEESFAINPNFASPRNKVFLSDIPEEEAQTQSEESKKEVFRDRQYQVDAAICRLLKVRKSLLTADLLDALQKILKFSPDIQDVTVRIESLVDREYIERDAHNPDLLHYLA
jgi:cullin-4